MRATLVLNGLSSYHTSQYWKLQIRQSRQRYSSSSIKISFEKKEKSNSSSQVAINFVRNEIPLNTI